MRSKSKNHEKSSVTDQPTDGQSGVLSRVNPTKKTYFSVIAGRPIREKRLDGTNKSQQFIPIKGNKVKNGKDYEVLKLIWSR